ncbi:MAG: DUF456 family protein [Anaerolineae bacterium]
MPAWLELALQILLLAAMLMGLGGLVIPFFPGITVIWALCLIYGLIYGFNTPGIIAIALITLLAIFGWLADNVLMTTKARAGGAHWLSILAAFVAGFIVSLVFTPLGGILAAFAAIFLVEYAYEKDTDAALRAVQNLFKGLGWAFILRFVSGALMIGIWGIWALLNWYY